MKNLRKIHTCFVCLACVVISSTLNGAGTSEEPNLTRKRSYSDGDLALARPRPTTPSEYSSDESTYESSDHFTGAGAQEDARDILSMVPMAHGIEAKIPLATNERKEDVLVKLLECETTARQELNIQIGTLLTAITKHLESAKTKVDHLRLFGQIDALRNGIKKAIKVDLFELSLVDVITYIEGIAEGQNALGELSESIQLLKNVHKLQRAQATILNARKKAMDDFLGRRK